MRVRALAMVVVGGVGMMLGSGATFALSRKVLAPRDSAPVVTAQPAAPAVTEPAPSTEPELVAARQALTARLRNPDTLRLNDVRIWQYGPADERAVCGTMQSAEIAGGSARFVVRVLHPRARPEAGGRPVQTVVEDAPWLVRASPEAARRFCREPEPIIVTSRATDFAGSTAPPIQPAESVVEPPRVGRVVTHSPANLRAAPGGEVLGAVPRGRWLTVFERAPGGWMRVGEAGPEGWVHGSLVTENGGPK